MGLMIPRPCVLQGIHRPSTESDPSTVARIGISAAWDADKITVGGLFWGPEVAGTANASMYFLRDGAGSGTQYFFGLLLDVSGFIQKCIFTRQRTTTHATADGVVDSLLSLRGRFAWVFGIDAGVGNLASQWFCRVGEQATEIPAYDSQTTSAGTPITPADNPYSWSQRDSGASNMQCPFYAMGLWPRVLTPAEMTGLASRQFRVPRDPISFNLNRDKDQSPDLSNNGHTAALNDQHLTSLNKDFPAYRIPA